VVDHEVAHHQVVGHAVALDVAERAGGVHAPRVAADHHGQLRLVVHVLDARGPHDPAAVPHEGVAELGEQRGLLGLGEVELGGVVAVVERHGDDAAGLEGRQPGDGALVQAPAAGRDHGAVGQLPHLLQAPALDHAAAAGRGGGAQPAAPSRSTMP